MRQYREIHIRPDVRDKSALYAVGPRFIVGPLPVGTKGECMPGIYQPGQRIDHYEIIRLLGQGGASRVYLAQDQRVLQEVVLKFPRDDVIGGAAIFARYQREVEIGRRLDHPHIQRHLNRGEERNTEYLVLEYLRGQTLRAVMKKQAPALLPVRCRGDIQPSRLACRSSRVKLLAWASTGSRPAEAAPGASSPERLAAQDAGSLGGLVKASRDMRWVPFSGGFFHSACRWDCHLTGHPAV